ncbi:putative ABC transporter substrate-binding protein [Actinoplanes missouriensis 431]|uniref:Putative ABC transporter substrate-binding protein n=1 Tax=Actinoplanes missouriensis (strain ATCC 14538 / DSM 43046 / CBS 188.64 / JCM 3121 / NBRC 102363 / NCIMB 12654 / NRRL B-3342 / UNCC 431) TaxID=512565 RepID=I0HDV1_ACTM4|nr:ABC transporter substrate-binding protein [Actinoplanes missouriensis]BAL91188.1 putative ABC transporter substrate-binding protein [Actinoplanes missouriensis 431]
MHSNRVLFRALTVLVVASVAAAGCGGTSSTETTTSTLTKPPITIGFLNPSGGPVPQPGTDTGVQAAQSYINGEFGGINGHPIEVVPCDTDTTPEKAQSCANTFVEKKVVAVLDGYNLSSSAALPPLTAAQIPLVGMIPFDSVTGAKPENRVFFAAPQASFLVGALQAFQSEGKKSVTLALVDTPSSHQTIDTLLPALSTALGIRAKGIYFSPTSPNFTAVASAIAKDNPDVGGLVAAPSEAVCTALVKALRQLNYQGEIFTAACTDYIKDAPEQAAGGALYSSNWLPTAARYAPPEVQSDLAIAEKHIAAVEGGTAGYYAYGEFALLVNLAKALTASGATASVTGADVLKTLKALKDFPSFLGPKITCGSATSPNCTTQMLLFSVQPDGSTKPVTDTWITPAAQVLGAIPGAV